MPDMRYLYRLLIAVAASIVTPAWADSGTTGAIFFLVEIAA